MNRKEFIKFFGEDPRDIFGMQYQKVIKSYSKKQAKKEDKINEKEAE